MNQPTFSRPTRHRPKGRRRLATLVAAGLTLIQLAAIAISNFQKPRVHRSKSSCVAHLKMIDGCKQQWAIDNKKTATDLPNDADLFGKDRYLKMKPVCPLDGTCSINAVGEDLTCGFAAKDAEYHSLTARRN